MSGNARFRKRGIGGVEDRRRRGPARGTNPVDVLYGRAAPSHLPTLRSMLDRMAAHFSDGRQDARSFPWHELTYAQVAEFRTLLGRQYAPRTANNYLSALKAVLRESKRLGLLDPATFETLTDQPPVRGETLPAGRHVQADELVLLFKYLGTLETASGARDRATFALLRGTGIRRAEAASLDLAAYAPFRSQLTVEHGKGRKERVVFLPSWVIEEVDDWLDWRGHEPGLLLCRVDKHDNVYPGHRLHPDTLWDRFVCHVEAAGVEHFTLHDLRRTFAGDLLEAGYDLVKVQRAMGHSDPIPDRPLRPSGPGGAQGHGRVHSCAWHTLAAPNARKPLPSRGFSLSRVGYGPSPLSCLLSHPRSSERRYRARLPA
jgi:integrase